MVDLNGTFILSTRIAFRGKQPIEIAFLDVPGSCGIIIVVDKDKNPEFYPLENKEEFLKTSSEIVLDILFGDTEHE